MAKKPVRYRLVWEDEKGKHEGGLRDSRHAASRDADVVRAINRRHGIKNKSFRVVTVKTNPPIKRAKPSGWISATRVKFVKRGGRMTVLVQKAKPKARAKRRGRR
jgi:hypothetical protein